MTKLKAEEYKKFEDIKHIREDGSEFWSARELADALEYTQWRNFSKVIERAMMPVRTVVMMCFTILLRSAKS